MAYLPTKRNLKKSLIALKGVSPRIFIVIPTIIAMFLTMLSPLVVDQQIYAAATPTAVINLEAENLVGEQFSFTASFTNTGDSEGYGPYIDLIFDFTGEDGLYPFDPGDEADGVNFINANFLGQSITSTVLQFTTENSGCVQHPYAVDTNNVPIEICGTEGDKLVVLQMPFGSFVPGQPNVDITVNVDLSELADVGSALNIQSRAGFQYGADSLSNPSTDPSIIGSFADNYTTPTLISLRKTYNGPESETATGPNFPRSYNVRADIADMQSLDTFIIQDLLPDNLEYLGFNSAFPNSGYTVTDTPVIPGPQLPTDNNLDVQWTSVLGGTGSNDANIDFDFFVPEFDANSSSIISPSNGGCVTSINDASAEGSWTPIDTRDVIVLASSDSTSNDYTLNACSMVIQKGVVNISDTGPTGNTPGDVLEYTLNFQISDYFAYQDIEINDIMSDGQRFDSGFIPTLSFNMHGSNTTGDIDGGNIEIFDHFTGGSPEVGTIDGTQEVLFNISDELITRSFSTGSVLGGCVPASGGTIDCTSTSATTGTLKFRSVIQQTFTDDYAPQNPNVDQGDILSNSVTIDGEILDNSDLTGTTNRSSNGSGATVQIVNGGLAFKEIYAINDVIDTYSTPKIGPGDEITYRIQFLMPSSDVEDLVITDYLPLPVFDSTELTTFDNSAPSATVPTAGTVKYGPNDSFSQLPSAPTPSLSSTSSSNTFELDYGSYQAGVEQATTIDIMFTITASDEPFADGLFLTNQAQSSQGTTNNSAQTATEIVQVELTLPNLSISKGVVSTDNVNGIYEPVIVGPVTFDTPGSSPSFTGTINSSNLDSLPVESDLSEVDASDIVTFATIIENTGQGINGAYDIQVRDIVPAGFSVPGTGLNLQVRNGSGTALAFTSVDGTDTEPFIEDGIDITDTSSGSIGELDPSSGGNILVITYDLQLDSDVEPEEVLVNEAVLFNYASSESGPDFTGDDITDEAEVTIKLPSASKVITSTNQVSTSGNDVVIGEIVTYEVELTVPEGITSLSNLVDTLDAGLAFVQINSITADTGISTDHSGSFSGVLTDTSFGANGLSATLPFDTITNSDTDNDTDEKITVEYDVVVLNVTGNSRTNQRNNTVVLNWDLGSINTSAPNVTIREPLLTVNKSSSLGTGDAGDTVTYTLVVDHDGNSDLDAHEVELEDILPIGITYSGNLTHDAGLAPDGGTLQENSGTISATWTTFGISDSSTISFDATIDNAVQIGDTITNNANIEWTSISGDYTTAQSGHNTNSTERTGDISDPGGSANDHNSSNSADVSILSVSPTKSIVNTSEPHTGVLSSVQNTAIGEIVRYRLQMRLAEATATNLQVRDRLPSGMKFLNDDTSTFVFVSNDSNIVSTDLTAGSTGCLASDINVVGNESTISSITPTCQLPDTAVSSNASSNVDTYNSSTDPRFKFGDLTNGDRDSDYEYLIVEFNALVMNVLGNQSGTTLNNRFDAIVDGSTVGQSSNGNPSRVRIVEPAVTISKSITTNPQDAGDSLVYELEIDNMDTSNNGATAFEIDVTDTLDSFITLDSITVSTPNGYTDSSSGNDVDVELDYLEKGEVAIITVYATVNSSVEPGQDIDNTAEIEFTSLPDSNGTLGNGTGSNNAGSSGGSEGERNGDDGESGLNNYYDSSDISTTLDSVSIDKLDISPTQYVIGDSVEYDVQVTMPEGIANNVIVTDELPDGLGYSSYEIISLATSSPLNNDFNGVLSGPVVSGGVGSGDDVNFTFSSITTTNDNDPDNNAYIIRVTAVVLNEVGTQRGDILGNTASMSLDAPGGGSINVADSTPVNISIEEPILQISKIATVVPSNVQSGSIVTYEIDLSHHSNSNADAYEVVLNDPASTGITNITNVSVSSTGSVSTPDSSVIANTIRVPSTGTFTLPNDGSTVIVTFDATVNIGASETVNNIANATWASLSSSNANRRYHGSPSEYDLSESGASGLNDYWVEDNDNTVSTLDPSIEKYLVDTSASHTSEVSNPAQLTIGETGMYVLRVGLAEGTTTSLEVNDNLTDNVEFLSYEIITEASNSFGVLTQDFDGTVPSPSCTECIVSSVGPDLEMAFTNIVNNVDGSGTNDFFAIGIRFQVLDETINSGLTPPGQSSFSNTATVQANSGSIDTSTTLDMEIVEPNVLITKEFDSGTDPDVASPNDTVTVEILFENDGTSEAFDLSWNDDLELVDSGVFNYAASTLSGSCSAGVTASLELNDSNAAILSATLAELPVGESCEISFDIILDSEINQSVSPVLTNRSDISEFSSLLGDVSGERTGSNYDTDDISVLVPDLTVVKTDNKDETDPASTNIYDITITNIGTVDANSVVVTETVPLNTTFDAAQSTEGWVCLGNGEAGDSCTFDLDLHIGGDLPLAGGNSTIQFAVIVDHPLDGSVVSIDNIVSVDSDDSKGNDPTPGNNTDSDSDSIGNIVDVSVEKSTPQEDVAFNQDLDFVLTYDNHGTVTAEGVVITETVPENSMFNAIESTPGWSCSPDTLPGSTCEYIVGSLEVDSPSSVNFVVTTNDYPPVYDEIINSVSIIDNGTYGPDVDLDNNQDEEVVPVLYTNVFDPPSAQKTVNEVGLPEIEWKMVWINDGNTTALLTRIIDPVPEGTEYVEGSFDCDARGDSITSYCEFDEYENQVVWEGDIAPDQGGTDENDSEHEVVLRFRTSVPDDMYEVENQAYGYWDDNGNGTIDDDISVGQSPVITNDPDTGDELDPTVWEADLFASGRNIIPIIIVSGFVLIFITAFAILRKRRKNNLLIFKDV